MADQKTTYLGQSDEAHPDVFNLKAAPPTSGEQKPGQLTSEQLSQFFTEGFVIVKDFFRRDELDPVRDAVAGLVDNLAQKLYKAGKIKDLYEDCGFFQRLTKIEEDFPGANVILHKQGTMPQPIRDLWSNERMLNVIEQLIGPEIGGSPVWNLRTKTPRNEATTVPWHQDSAYFDKESYKIMIPTAWIPLLDTNEQNGCMQMVRRGHKTGKIATHQCCYGNTWYVILEEDEMEKTLDVSMKEDVVTCPIPYGGFLLFNNITPHRSLNNVSNDIRWSLDLRWQNPSNPWGLWGLKEGVLMRSAKEPVTKIDWEPFMKKDRTSLQSAHVGHEESEFDTTIHGPWMKSWEIIHMNKHTEAAGLTGR